MRNTFSVIQICPCYVDLGKETGGVANVVRQICLQLANQHMQVLLLCGNRELGKIKAPPGRTQINDFLTIEVFEQGSHPLLGPTKGLIARIKALEQPCVAHVHTCFSAFTEDAMSTLHNQNIPFIFTPHGKLTHHFLKQSYWPKKVWWFFKGKTAIRNASMIGAISTEEAHQMATLGLNRPMQIVPNGYEIPRNLSTSDNARIIPTPYILFLGYLDPRKQPEFLVDAYSRSHTSRNHRLVFVGPNPYSHQDVIAYKADVLGISDKVCFYGAAYGAEKWNLLRNATCICLPSLGEGLPVVLCEALGAGIPSIFSKECNFSEIATAGAGIMLSDFNPAAWADAIDSICLDEDYRSRMRKSAELQSPQYTWQGIAQRWRELYTQISSRAR